MHDVAEAIVGDITPHDGVSKEEKRIMEETAMKKIADELDSVELAKEAFDLWLEYELGVTEESKIAKQLDKLEMIIQANEYEIANPGIQLNSFFDYCVDIFTHPEVKAWADKLYEDRSKRLADANT